MNGISENITASKRRKIDTNGNKGEFGNQTFRYCRECLLLDPPSYNNKIANKKRMLCQLHYKRFYAKNHCREEGCRRLKKDKDGLCAVHSKQFGRKRTCATSKCENPLKRRAKYCNKCYMRHYRQGKRGQRMDEPGQSTSDIDSPRIHHGLVRDEEEEEEEEEEGEDSTDDRREHFIFLLHSDDSSYPEMMEAPCLGEIVSPRQSPPSSSDTSIHEGQWLFIQDEGDSIYLSPCELGYLGNASLSSRILYSVFSEYNDQYSTTKLHT